jgi:hypothetical protein
MKRKIGRTIINLNEDMCDRCGNEIKVYDEYCASCELDFAERINCGELCKISSERGLNELRWMMKQYCCRLEKQDIKALKAYEFLELQLHAANWFSSIHKKWKSVKGDTQL